jgi:hypothetical protein
MQICATGNTVLVQFLRERERPLQHRLTYSRRLLLKALPSLYGQRMEDQLRISIRKFLDLLDIDAELVLIFLLEVLHG